MAHNPLTVVTLVGVLTIDCAPSIAFAQNSDQGSSSAAGKFSGSQVEGDPNGAVRALGSADDGNKKNKPTVQVPHLGGEGSERTGGPPPGTAR